MSEYADVRSEPVLLIAQFSPPVHGLSLAMDRLADLLASLGPIIKIRTVPERQLPRYRHHAARGFLVWRAALQLAQRRHGASAVVLSVDGGAGMLYGIVLVLVSRLLGYQITLDHHSYAYVAKRSVLMSGLVAVAGRASTHLFKCPMVLAKFRRMYSLGSPAVVLGVAYAADPPVRPPRPRLETQPLVLGHLSNLSIEKGLADVLRVSRAAVERSLASKLVLAGPLSGPVERRLIDAASLAGYAEYRGPVYDEKKELFFQDVDVFLFPSRYQNELSPVVVWESLLRGIPIIGYAVGCLTAEAAGPGSLITDPSESFLEPALRQLRVWREAPEALARAGQSSREHAEMERRNSVVEALTVGRRLRSYHR